MIRQQTSRVNQVFPADFSFSRASTGYNTKGKLYMPNQIRLESVIYGGSMVLVEEAATNLLTAAEALELSAETTKTVTSGVSYTIKIHGSYGTITLSGAATGIIAAGSSLTVTTTSTSLVLTPAQTNSMWPTYIQLEQKAYPTSFCMPGSPRAAESLTMPTTGLSVSEGTNEGIFEVTDISKRQDGNSNRLFRIVGSSGYIMAYHQGGGALWNFVIYNGTNGTTISIADSLTPNAFYYYKVRWSASEAVIEFWDLSTQTKVASGTITSPYLPSAFGSYVYLGSNDGSSYFINTRFGKHRLSNIARTADPDFNNLMPRDSNTTYLIDFDDIVFRAAQNMMI
jgi:hypothetical protein